MDPQRYHDKRKLDIGKKCDLQLLQIRDYSSQLSYNKAGWRFTLHLPGWVDLMVKNFNFKILKSANVQNPHTTSPTSIFIISAPSDIFGYKELLIQNQ
jgi:hypothetical protein